MLIVALTRRYCTYLATLEIEEGIVNAGKIDRGLTRIFRTGVRSAETSTSRTTNAALSAVQDRVEAFF